MKYSLVDGQRSEAQPGLAGECQICGSSTIAKCGEVKMWHWAHKGKRMCDPWWENETEWHRNWKNCFPMDWQEIIHKDTNGEKHIADVKTAQSWAIEFQHSFLKPEERRARNAFYEKLVWVVDGMRRARDKSQFFKMLKDSALVRVKPEIRRVSHFAFDECALLREWGDIDAPVFFDFGDEELWCLLPANKNTLSYVVSFSRLGFIKLHNDSADQIKNFEYWLNQLNNLVLEYTLKQSRMRENGVKAIGLSSDPLLDLVRKRGYHALPLIRKRGYRGRF